MSPQTHRLTCKSCRYFSPIVDAKGTTHPGGLGNCCVNPPTAVPMMHNPGPTITTRPITPQPVTIGIDPPVSPDRIACRHYSREFLDA